MNINDLNKIAEIVKTLTAQNANRLADILNDKDINAKTKKEAKAASEWYQAGIDEVFASIHDAMLKGGL